ncbi:hypothetical protein [Streptomyces sp. P17]|nr:hypothetical protein [Streptomyces sp. P17]MDT9696848.1 hypothetical protein [Streptomyces sp. P17]
MTTEPAPSPPHTANPTHRLTPILGDPYSTTLVRRRRLAEL